MVNAVLTGFLYVAKITLASIFFHATSGFWLLNSGFRRLQDGTARQGGYLQI
ncbi:MAG: hypothetical protein M1609_16215 [Firmicutes bacterium]|nr:hypothetical protein [Bacillota bacterium]